MIETEMTIQKLEEPKLEEWDELTIEMRRDLLALDLRISLFVGAVQNFKYESLLKPIPANYRKSDGEADIKTIRELVSRLPELPIRDLNYKPDPQLTTFMKTFFLNHNQQLSLISVEELKRQVGGQIELQIAPRWIFQIDHVSRNQQTWERRKASSSSFYAFHGSRFENFHSILNLGLHQHLNKTALFGEGIYLSTEQSLSLQYSPCGQGWSKSQLGPELSLLAICEVIDHPDVKRRGSRPSTGSMAIPDKYILVTNNELVRPRYFLVYTRPKVKTVKVTSFVERHKFVLFLSLYVSLLLAIGLAKKVAV
ncbi:protein mono-ADP-ribosyltransferase PARP16-like [Daphnia pulicaria]|uniref:protein mono-ADP-ribosyltransferase PARP16-like n=1 Tax=Daphnia pulicaria TaxID=35523 RepID=UPI001EEA62C0|nr:protein mono-ADP-ribosyltransferase PARP16-like [Daphnia pulicaria]